MVWFPEFKETKGSVVKIPEFLTTEKRPVVTSSDLDQFEPTFCWYNLHVTQKFKKPVPTNQKPKKTKDWFFCSSSSVFHIWQCGKISFSCSSLKIGPKTGLNWTLKH